MRFDLVDLRLFLHVTEAGSVTHGAQRSNLALASASARIRGMEIALGVPLLARDRRGVTLLPAGQCLLEHARLIVQQVERMRGELGSFARGLAGSVRLLSNTAALSEYLPRVLAGFPAANRSVSMSRSARARTSPLPWDPGQLTWGLPPLPCCQTLSSSFHFAKTCLFSFSLSLRKTARRRALALAEVVDRAFVGLPRDSALQRHIVGHATRLGATMNIRARVTSLEAVCRMVEAGAGIGIVPEVSAKRCRRSMNIDVVRLSDAWAKRRLAICVRRLDSLPAGARRLVAHLRQAAIR
jgi:DNA-binding transcriptional LysR family regulator